MPWYTEDLDLSWMGEGDRAEAFELLTLLPELRFDRRGTDDKFMEHFRADHPGRHIAWRVESLPGGGMVERYKLLHDQIGYDW